LTRSKLRTTSSAAVVGGGAELPCSPDDEDCADEFSGELELQSTARNHLVVTSSRPPARSSPPTRRPSTSASRSTTESTTTAAAWRPRTSAPAPVTYDPRLPAYTSPVLDRGGVLPAPPPPSDYPLDVGAARLDELDQLKLNVALIIGVAVCFSLLLLTLVLVVYRYRVVAGVGGGRRRRSAGDKAAAAAAASYAACCYACRTCRGVAAAASYAARCSADATPTVNVFGVFRLS